MFYVHTLRTLFAIKKAAVGAAFLKRSFCSIQFVIIFMPTQGTFIPAHLISYFVSN